MSPVICEVVPASMGRMPSSRGAVALMAGAALGVAGPAGACQQPVTASAGTHHPVSTHRPSPAPSPSDYPGDTTSASWGSPVVAENFNRTRLDPAKWVVYDSPNDRVNPRTSSATRLSGGA